MAEFCSGCGRRTSAQGWCTCGNQDDGPTVALRADRLAVAGARAAPMPHHGTGRLPIPNASPVARLDLTGRVRQRRLVLVTIVMALVALASLGAALLLVTTSTTATSQASPVVSSAGTSGSTGAATSRDPGSLLEAQRQGDLSALSGSAGSWFPQLSSKKVGTRADGRTYDESAIWSHFQGLQARYPQARLVWSDDWGSFRQGGYWVVIVDSPSASGASANAWCEDEGFPADACYAKRLATSGGYSGNTIPRG